MLHGSKLAGKPNVAWTDLLSLLRPRKEANVFFPGAEADIFTWKRADLILFSLKSGTCRRAAETAKLNLRLVALKIKSTAKPIGAVGNFFLLTTKRSESLLLQGGEATK